MSRSYRKAYCKDKGTETYNRVFRSRCNQMAREICTLNEDALDRIEFPNIHTVVDDWDVCDWRFDFETVMCEHTDIYRRK